MGFTGRIGSAYKWTVRSRIQNASKTASANCTKSFARDSALASEGILFDYEMRRKPWIAWRNDTQPLRMNGTFRWAMNSNAGLAYEGAVEGFCALRRGPRRPCAARQIKRLVDRRKDQSTSHPLLNCSGKLVENTRSTVFSSTAPKPELAPVTSSSKTDGPGRQAATVVSVTDAQLVLRPVGYKSRTGPGMSHRSTRLLPCHASF